MNTKKIIIDHRENADKLIKLLQDKFYFEVDVRQLKYGDYFVEPDITLERKSTRDFLLSIIDGRLFKQAYRLAEYTERPIILIEGRSFRCTGVDVSIELVKGTLT